MAPVQVRAVADAGVLLAQRLRQLRVALQDHVLDPADGQDGEHLAHDLVDQDPAPRLGHCPGLCGEERLERSRPPAGAHSHSMVAGGFDEMSYTTRFTPWTSFVIRLEMRASSSCGSGAQSAVIASRLVTQRSAIAFS